MGYQIIPNIIFFVSISGIILIFLKHLPEAKQIEESRESLNIVEKLEMKGLPTEQFSKIKSLVLLWLKKSWNFILEAKDIRYNSPTGYKIKKIFQNAPQLPALKEKFQKKESILTEQDYIDLIKTDPKNLDNYDALGRLYIEQKNFTEAKDIYIYLTGHSSSNHEYFSRLGIIHFSLKDYKLAAESFEKSISLDSTHPNRYYNLGLSRKLLGETQEALESMRKALALEPENQKYKDALSELENHK